jgi:hypothetical protein
MQPHHSARLVPGKPDRASKELSVRYMSQEQDVPEAVLSDIVADLVDKRRYLSYTDPEEWEPFFKSMASIIHQIVSKNDQLRTEAKVLREREG